MPYDAHTTLWLNRQEAFFRSATFTVQRQVGPHCVSTVLAMLTGQTPERFQGRVNTQNPVSWSEALAEYGMKLAYCPTDVRTLKNYLPELIDLDDLFTLSYYTTRDPERILAEPNANGWVTGSHIVLLHRDHILDSASGTVEDARSHRCNDYHTKRIFRVVPVNHPRGL